MSQLPVESNLKGVDAKNGILYFFIRPIFEVNSELVTLIAVTSFLFMLNLYFTTVPIQFVNRYIYLTQFHAMDIEIHMKMSCSAVIASALLSLSIFVAFHDSEERYKASLTTLQSDPFYADEIPPFITCNNRSQFLIMYFAAIITLAIAVGGVIVYCNKHVYDRLSRIKKFIRKDTVKAAQQISNVLIVQVFVMLVFYFAPTIVLIGGVYTSLSDMTVVLMLIIPVLQLAPVVNAVAAIVLIKCYRERMTCNGVNSVTNFGRDIVSENVSIPPFECEADQRVPSVDESTV
uniref:G-protein coupled receptors family 1 profile domain-containing protein n=1 Tax=Panagrellus redivivus TaxID=6233 RepID=A0A7E4UMD9_PANRE